MNYCAIGPLSLESYFAHHSHHMALAQYLENQNYLNFFKERIAEGKFVVLDSGVYENAAVSDNDLIHWCQELKPSAVILPDEPHNAEQTDRKSYRFAEQLHQSTLLGNCPRMWKVIHAAPGNFEEFATSYVEGAAAFQGVCFSRLTANYGTGYTLHPRSSFINRLKEEGIWDKNLHHHALGMNYGSLKGFKSLAALKIDTIDSSAPIWRGVHGEALPQEPTSFFKPFDPFWEPTEAHFDDTTLLDNLQQVGVCVS